MNRNKLIILIVCGIIVLAAACVVLVGLTSGQWAWQNNSGTADHTGLPSENETQTGVADDTNSPDDTGDVTDAPSAEEVPTIGIEVEDNSGSGNSGNSGSSGSSGSSGGNKTEIDFDDLLGKEEDNKKPTTESTTPESTTPEETTPEATTPSTTVPDTEDDYQSGEKPQDTDIDIPI